MNGRWSHIWLALVVGALAPSCDEAKPPPPPPPAPVVAENAPVPRAHLMALRGDVKIKRAAGDEWQPAQEGISLYENDKVRTVAGAGVQISFASGGSVNIGEDALVSIAETRAQPGHKRTDLTVLRGRVDAELGDPTRQSLSVTTPAATVRAGREIMFQ